LSVDDYARACGVPKEVRIGGRLFRVAKLGPRTVGELQRWMTTVLDDPRMAARDALAADPALPDAAARRLWTEAALAARDWPPQPGDELGALLLESPEGRARLLWAAARGDDPALTLAACRAAAGAMTAGEWDDLQAAAAPRELGDVIDPDPPGPAVPYTEIRALLCANYGWRHADVDALSFDQIRMAWTAGKPDRGVPVDDAQDAARVDARWRQYVYGL
jgi:hypothetical protein